ncbi:FecCD family ABC transporter permease [Paenibacillus silviterrae]|uniref:FecCD family ABC transporter permease n=1 Tax=Paenibacillus silviterrae TaxID=3242194 RepID=UPI0025430BAB|nr:iron ABC transporter permease [Paenibacillus chinjuensis]
MKKLLTLRNRGGSVSFLLQTRALWVTLALIVVVAVIAVLSIGLGSSKMALSDVLRTLFGYGTSAQEVIIFKLRMPRILIAILTGSALAVAGAILQGVIRNPLASPEWVGITGGATLGAVAFFFFWAETLTIHLLPVAAMVGAFVVSAFIYVTAWKHGVSPLRLVLIGIGMSTAMSSLTYMLLISGPMVLANKSLTFMTGSIYGVSWDKDVYVLLPWVGVLIPLAWLLARHVNVQQLGDDVAASVGTRVEQKRLVLLLLSVALAGSAVAIGGAISFIGLMAPHIARKLVGPSFGGVIPTSALIGALILLLADLVARTAFAPLDIPAGVFTAAIGAPFFIYLLLRQRAGR